MTIFIVLLLALATVVLAGGSLRRKGRWSQRTFLLSVGMIAFICCVAAAFALLGQ